MLKIKTDQNSQARKEKKSPDKVRKELTTPSTNLYGSYLPTKKIDFNESEDLIKPKLVDESKQKNPQVFDLRVHKKGLNFHGYD